MKIDKRNPGDEILDTHQFKTKSWTPINSPKFWTPINSEILDTHGCKSWTPINSNENTDAIGNPYRVTDL
jgi:hypothetical protein